MCSLGVPIWGRGDGGEECSRRSLLSLPAGRTLFVGASAPVRVRALGGCTSLGHPLPVVARAKQGLVDDLTQLSTLILCLPVPPWSSF